MSMTRRRFLASSSCVALGVAAWRTPRIELTPAFDLVLKGGLVLDGMGAPAFTADIGIVGDSIAGLGTISPEQARRVLDVSGLHIAPGFIDVHSHSDSSILMYPTADSQIGRAHV